MTRTCSWCKMGFLGPGVADHEGRVYCTLEHRASYLADHPARCDCGCQRTNPTIVLGLHRFATSSCLIGYETAT
jgi:hypothetical protein